MKPIDRSVIFLIFGVLFFTAVFDVPIFITAIVAMMLYRGINNQKRKNQREDQRNQTNDRRYQQRRDRTTDHQRRQTPAPSPRPQRKTRVPKSNPYKTSGVKKFKDYDYEGAIEDFNKALQINSNDISVHFNLACSYSLTEDKNKALYHLDKAVDLGFKDFEKIKTHDALAYLRIQDEFEAFQQNNYQLTNKQSQTMESSEGNSELLEQLQKLAELREKGLLTEEEFVLQKKKLLG